MGVSCSCPLAVYCDFDTNLESMLVKTTNLQEDDQNKPKDSESKTLQSLGSGKLLLNGSFKSRAGNTQTMKFNKRTNFCVWPRLDSLVGPNSPKHEAALKLQKVYKSFRTRRKLADCAVLIEHSWWRLLDFAELKHSSISFFDLDKHETAISRWSRARTRAAKVGKGLSKNSKARKLALQHWLEAIDPRHRYGHNLHFYYIKWLNSQSKEPFFYWLNSEGKEVNLIEKCPRSKLQQQCIKYLGPCERKAYEISVEDGKLLYAQTGEYLNTTNEPKGCKWIFVLSTSKTLYVGLKKKGSFQHSSFLAGGATLAAGRVVAENGVLKAVWPHSGHYKPTPENFQDFISFLRENNVDLTDVKLDSIDDEEDYSVIKQESVYLRSNSSEDELTGKDCSETEETETSNQVEKESVVSSSNLTTLQIPSNTDFFEQLKNEYKDDESNTSNYSLESPMDGYETQEEFLASEEEIIPEDSILRRISSHKETKSFQLGKQLSCKWSTGAGPRIGCVRDYPSGLQCHALEQVNLSPRSERRLRFDYPSRGSTPNSSLLSRSRSQAVRRNP